MTCFFFFHLEDLTILCELNDHPYNYETGFLKFCTPQEVALQVTVRVLKMYKKHSLAKILQKS